ncbi:conserved hypothetical protein [uncultured Desulfatiglans sp.]|nr:conserved hypothetical protein [uncultured Desulfatiglans sp.]
MLDDIKKGLLAGLGMVFLTKDKIEETARKMVDEARMSKEDARRLTDELLETGEKQWSRIEENITETVHKGLRNLDVGSRKELDELRSRVQNLEERVSLLEAAKDPIEG